MVITSVGLFAIALWLAAALRFGVSGAALTAAVFLPMSGAAAMVLPALGGLNVLCSALLLTLTAALVVLTGVQGGRGRARLTAHVAAIPLMLFTVYAVASAFFLPRIFAGDVWVVPLSRGLAATGISVGHFGQTLAPLQPGSSNLAQAAYIILDLLYFLIFFTLFRIGGPRFVTLFFGMMSGVIAVTGVIDFLGGDATLDLLRTGNYSILDHHRVFGLDRIIGVTAEASTFGGFAALATAFWLSYAQDSGRPRHLAAAALLGALAVLTVSATALTMLGVLGAIIGARLFVETAAGRLDRTPALITLLTICGLAGVGVVIAASPIGAQIGAFLNTALFTKLETQSAAIRGHWAAAGMRTFVETYGLGAGAGSIRSNGMVSSFLGSVGIFGSLTCVAFIVLALRAPSSPLPRARDEADIVRRACVTASLIAIVGALLSKTTPNVGPHLILLLAGAAAMGACSGREDQAVRPAPAPATP